MTRDIFSKNADYQKFEVLKSNRNKRHRYGEFFVEGVRNLNQARENGWEFAAFLYARDRALSRWAQEMLEQVPAPIHYRLAGELLDSLSGKEDGSELMAVVKMRQGGAQLLRRPANPLWVLFDRPSNRGNLGSLLRSCDGLGADGLILTGHGVDLYDPEVVTASMGSFFRVPAVQLENSQAAAFLAAMRDGLSYAFKQSCDQLCTIPMAEDSSASSFNVACAGTVLLYEVSRQRAPQKK